MRRGQAAAEIRLDRIERLIRRNWRTQMADTAALETALANVSSGLDAIGTEVAQLATQIGEIVAGTTSQATIDALAATAQALADRAFGLATTTDAAYEPDAGEEPPAG